MISFILIIPPPPPYAREPAKPENSAQLNSFNQVLRRQKEELKAEADEWQATEVTSSTQTLI